MSRRLRDIRAYTDHTDVPDNIRTDISRLCLGVYRNFNTDELNMSGKQHSWYVNFIKSINGGQQ